MWPEVLGRGPCQPAFGGDKRDRTADPLLAKQVLSQLSYTPAFLHNEGSLGVPSKLNINELLMNPLGSVTKRGC